jgi:hypothetical protein
MTKKKSDQAAKYSVGEVLKSISWSVEDDRLILLSTLTDEYVTIGLEAIMKNHDGETEQD